MSCFFCNSLTHVSHFCDICISNKSRMKNAKSKNFCEICLTKLSENHNDLRCNYNKKCVICFSKTHHSAFCSDRINAREFFIPNIDKDLFLRFIRLLNLEEKYSLAFLSSITFDLIKLKHLNVVEKLMGNERKEMGSNFVVTKRFDYRRTQSRKIYLPPLNSTIYKCANIILRGITLFPEEFLHLLSVKVRHIECISLKLRSTLKFSDILKAAPNIEYFNFCDTNLETGKSWPEDILKWKNGKNLRMLKIQIQNIYFNIKSLIEVIEEKSANGVEIFLDINCDSNPIGEWQTMFENISTRMLTDFVSGKNANGRAFVKICFTYVNAPILFSYNPFFTMM